MPLHENPYVSPQTQASSEKPLVAQGLITETMLIHLKAAAPWMVFIAILGFVTSGFTALWGIASFSLAPFFGSAYQFGNVDFANIFGIAIFGASMAVLSFGGAVIIFFPSLFLYRFGNKIRAYLRSGTDGDLEAALKNNKSLWKFYGILCIVYLSLLPVLIIGIVIWAIATAL